MPVGIDERKLAGGVEPGDMLGRQAPADGPQVLHELPCVARADDKGGDGGAAQKPVERDLGDGLAGLGGDLVDGGHDFEQMLFGDLRADVGDELGVEAAVFWDAGFAADLAG